MALQVVFWILAVIGVISALSVVLLRDVFRAALALIMCFLAVAGIFVTLSADFLAVVQILIYVGAVSVLIILAVMMTKEIKQGSLNNKLTIPAFIVAGLFLAVLLYSVLTTSWSTVGGLPPDGTTENLALKLFDENGFILPVEIAAMLILASILGAITLVREK
ncbi:MAG: NADH-quinone oxidoreductase subunit J [Dehalococcoidales bacterium]|nr:NADH-quinone oxidoreductase subunit J [Dehalococcoidales bacterium]